MAQRRVERAVAEILGRSQQHEWRDEIDETG
jgi:hypothetical protein